jgi:hypothetical protein
MEVSAARPRNVQPSVKQPVALSVMTMITISFAISLKCKDKMIFLVLMMMTAWMMISIQWVSSAQRTPSARQVSFTRCDDASPLCTTLFIGNTFSI